MTENVENKAEKKAERKTEKKSEKKKIRFNVVDIIIIVAVIACIGGVVLRIALSESFKKSNVKDYRLTFKAEEISYPQYLGIDKALDEAETQGNILYFADNGEKIGELHSITDFAQQLNLNDGTSIKLDGDDSLKEDSVWYIKGTLICRGENSDENGFLLNGKTFIAANQNIKVTTKYAQFTLKIVGIEEYTNTIIDNR